MKFEEYTQEELKQLSEAFLIVYKKDLGYYPDDYSRYLVGWKNKDKTFSYGSYDEGNNQVLVQDFPLWNFPIRQLHKQEIEQLKIEEKLANPE